MQWLYDEKGRRYLDVRCWPYSPGLQLCFVSVRICSYLTCCNPRKLASSCVVLPLSRAVVSPNAGICGHCDGQRGPLPPEGPVGHSGTGRHLLIQTLEKMAESNEASKQDAQFSAMCV